MQGREFIGVMFECCNVYVRAYLNRDRSAYTAICPRCGRPIKIGISSDGSDSRFFTVG